MSEINRADIARRAAGSVLIAGIAALPLSIEYGLEHASASDAIGQFPTDFKYSGDGNSHLTFGGTASAPITKYGIGMRASVELPATQTISDLISPDFYKVYAAQFNQPEKAVAGYESLLRDDFYDQTNESWLLLSGLGGGLLYAGSEIARRQGMRRPSKKLVASLAIAAVASTSLVAYSNLQRWDNQTANAESEQYELPSLDGTTLEGTTVDKPVLRTIIENAVPTIKKIAERQREQNDVFRTAFEASLEQQITKLEAPTPSESSYVLLSDMHSNTLATEFLTSVVTQYNQTNPDALQAVVNVGDLTYGTAAEAGAITDQAAAADGRPMVVIPGNHDSNTNIEQMDDAGMTVASDGIVEAGNLTIAGRTDPNVTPLFGSTRQRGNETQQQAGAIVREQIADNPVDVVALHEAYAAASDMGVDSVKDIPADRNSYRSPRADQVPDILTSAVAYGHWHDEVEPKVVNNSNGTWTVIFELGTAGGAIDDSTYANFSLPNAVPKKVASFFMVFRNDTSGLVTGFQRVRLYPSGKVSIAERTNVGSIDGQPYNVLPN